MYVYVDAEELVQELYEFKTAAHHVTVVNIVKSIWPSCRIMRKQFEGKSKSTSSAQLIQ